MIPRLSRVPVYWRGDGVRMVWRTEYRHGTEWMPRLRLALGSLLWMWGRWARGAR